MAASGPEVLTAPERPPHRGVASRQLLLAVACLTAGIVPFARWLPGDFVPVAYTALALALRPVRTDALRCASTGSSRSPSQLSAWFRYWIGS